MDNKELFLDLLKNDPLFFTKDILGKKLWSIQKKIVMSVKNNPRTTVKGCHGFGKSFIAGNIILQYLYSNHNSIVLSTAPTFRQVEKLIWKEVRSSYNNSRIKLGGNLAEGTPTLQILKDQWYAMGLSTTDGDKFQGFHEENILVVVDEAAGVPETIFNSIEGLLTSANARLLLIGNPTSNLGTFKKSFEDSSYNKYSVSAFDTPNFKYLDIKEVDIESGKWLDKLEAKESKIIMPKMITPQWVADKYKRWGKSSILYRSRVMGDFDETGTDSLIPLSWIEQSQQRWLEHQENKTYKYSDLIKEIKTEKVLGVDVAEFGRDTSVIFERENNFVKEARVYSKLPIMQFAGHIITIYNECNIDNIRVDTIGVGTGVEGRLDELGANTYRINVGESPVGTLEEKKKYINKRAQMYWSLREQLNPDININPNPISLPDDDELLEELMAHKYKINSTGQIQIIPKDEIKSILGRSPDKADALVLCVAPDNILNQNIIKKKAGTW